MNHGHTLTRITALAAAATLAALLPFTTAMGPPAPAHAASAKESFTADPVHSALVFKISHDGAGTFLGRFDKIEGSFNLDPASADASFLHFTVPTDSVSTANADRDRHLKSPDFFNVRQYPSATFRSTSVRNTGPESFDAAGDLTLHGVTKPVTVKITRAKQAQSSRSQKTIAGFEASFTINRNDFAIDKFPGMLGDDVSLTIGIEGGKREE